MSKHEHKYVQIESHGRFPDYSKWLPQDALLDIVMPQVRTSKRVLLCERCGDIKEVIKVHDEELVFMKHVKESQS